MELTPKQKADITHRMTVATHCWLRIRKRVKRGLSSWYQSTNVDWLWRITDEDLSEIADHITLAIGEDE